MDLLFEYWPIFLEGTINTILISFFAVLIGLVFGSLLALLRLSQNTWLNLFAKAYIQVVRGTPLLVQLFIIYFGLTSLNLSSFASGVIAVGFNATAYVAEIIRSGIQSVDKGQMEAALAIGMSRKLAMQKIIFPQAIKNILPAIGNEFAALIKETSIVSYLGIRDIMFASDIVRGATFQIFPPLFIAAGIYLILTSVIAYGVGRLEKRLKASD
ncbi:amino acid ABC transporter permease [Fundicoccus culcitae]|uniref:Amino acid ABC transporter permease n=1 Tax=Fundicoccus culcitae TaxID=2969821 RepID=A0ABY5P5K7_9LACT|nr:amino acid ABC transporter permease [Fundicoccus culcitae]UUX33895.1 amino acid ABC transporter permease [Fundicoccus culcitae]